MSDDNISASGLAVNPNVDAGNICHASAVRSELQKLNDVFVRRIEEELGARSDNAISRDAKKAGYTMSQSTVSRVRARKQNPSLEIVAAFAEALQVPAWFLLVEKGQAEQRIIRPAAPQNVVSLRRPYDRIFKTSPAVAVPVQRAKKRKR